MSLASPYHSVRRIQPSSHPRQSGYYHSILIPRMIPQLEDKVESHPYDFHCNYSGGFFALPVLEAYGFQLSLMIHLYYVEA